MLVCDTIYINNGMQNAQYNCSIT